MSHPAQPDLQTAQTALILALSNLTRAMQRGRWTAVHTGELAGTVKELSNRAEKLEGLIWVAGGTDADDAL